MRVVLPGGEVVHLGTTGTAPTIGITDYSRRVTDDFGVTTVVERGFARRMSVRMAVPFDQADALQRRLAGLRATSALWIADDRFASLSVQGFYKDFDIDLGTSPISYCTLEVEGLAASEPVVDAGGDPAPDGQISTLQLIQPVTVATPALVASNVAENDAPEWVSTISYPLGARVLKAATHRVYESLSAVNIANDPAGTSGRWLDLGPTNRWAMFDQALGTSTTRAGSIAVTLNAGAAGAVALLDAVGATARVQAPGYDRTVAIGAGAVTFLDLPGVNGQVTVTITGPGDVSVGTLLIGRLVSLGITEASPTAGITDYSRKDVDEFGEVTIVQRAWAKRMTARALIRTDALDVVANRIAAVRARPSLWIGQAGLDSLTVYGFFKDFSIEVGESVSKLSLSIEGLSKAAKVSPIGGVSDWDDLTDRTGTKPADNATNTGDPNAPFGPGTVGDVISGNVERDRLLALNGTNILGQVLRGDAQAALIDLRTFLNGEAIGTVVTKLQERLTEGLTSFAQELSIIAAKNAAGNGVILNAAGVYIDPDRLLTTVMQSLEQSTNEHEASITDMKEILFDASGETLRSVMTMTLDGAVTGIVNTLTGKVGTLKFFADVLEAVQPNGGTATKVFGYGTDGVLEIPNARIKNLAVGVVTTETMAQFAVGKDYAVELGSNFTNIYGSSVTVMSLNVVKDDAASGVQVDAQMRMRALEWAGFFTITYQPQGGAEQVMDTLWYWPGAKQEIGGVNSLRMPVAYMRRFQGIPAGAGTWRIRISYHGGSSSGGWIEAGSGFFIEEKKR